MKLNNAILYSLFIILISCGDDIQISEIINGQWELSSLEISDCPVVEDNVPLMLPDSDGCVDFDDVVLCNLILTFSSDLLAVETYLEDGDMESDNYGYAINEASQMILLCEGSSDCESLAYKDNTLTRIILNDGCLVTAVYTKI